MQKVSQNTSDCMKQVNNCWSIAPGHASHVLDPSV